MDSFIVAIFTVDVIDIRSKIGSLHLIFVIFTYDMIGNLMWWVTLF